jgi:hypothetical protein
MAKGLYEPEMGVSHYTSSLVRTRSPMVSHSGKSRSCAIVAQPNKCFKIVNKEGNAVTDKANEGKRKVDGRKEGG